MSDRAPDSEPTERSLNVTVRSLSGPGAGEVERLRELIDADLLANLDERAARHNLDRNGYLRWVLTGKEPPARNLSRKEQTDVR